MPDVTQKDAAERLGISPSWLRKLTRRGAIKRNSDRSYPWPKVREQFFAFQRVAEEERQAGFGNVPYEAARARKVAAQARLAELEAGEREGHLIQTEDHIAVIADILIDPEENVYPMIPAGAAHYEMKLGPDKDNDAEPSDKAMVTL